MKKYILYSVCLIGSFIIGSFTSTSEVISHHPSYQIRIIDGCEYIQITNGNTPNSWYNYAITHKGDCKNKIHRCKTN